MTAPTGRLRTHPAERFAGAEHVLDLPAALQRLRAETQAAGKGHQQLALAHHGPLRLVLYAFDAGGGLPQHGAPGWVTIQVLSGALRVRTADAEHVLATGQLLLLAPDVRHDVHATEAAEMLLGVYPPAPVNAAASPESPTSPTSPTSP